MKFETKAIRLQTKRSDQREHSSSIFPTSSFVFDDAEQMRALFADEQKGNIYSRFTNPNCTELENKMAALENTETALVTATGMAAIFATFMSHLKSGDHILCSRAVFGSTHSLLANYLPDWGIEYDFVDASSPESWPSKLRSNSRMLFIETPSNPGLDIIDIELAGEFARAHGLIYVVDNCFATPYLQQPGRDGADIILHSATKYIDGQGRVMGGIVAGSEDLLSPVKKFCRSSGPSLSPFNAWLLSKSLETLAVRMDRHCSNAMQLANFLSSNEQVAKVKYPFLESHPSFSIAKKQMRQGGGLVAFELKGGLAQGRRFLDAIELLSLSANLGDTRSIATHPASTTHAKVAEPERLKTGITNGLVRISVGLEHIDDIIADIDQALQKSVA